MPNRIDHRTLKAQRIDREPTIHIGVTTKHMELAGNSSDQLREYREIIKENTLLTSKEKAEFMHGIKQTDM